MSETQEAAFDALLRAARAEFAASLVPKADLLHALLARDEWREGRRVAHKLRGSAATYGFPAVSASASAIEDVLSVAEGAPDAAGRARLMASLGELREQAERASRGQP
jgi:HPt (histidine-containing phosphotransfer) domain-containing protein